MVIGMFALVTKRSTNPQRCTDAWTPPRHNDELAEDRI
jgi:hypothetical protein